ncbi:MAG: helix-hairpin-helix domain-containing protein [Deltaproteobacteria bacterium]|nr:helix-hairpin-helix domain-containing protein [Deltaproteobacteria bacterium]
MLDSFIAKIAEELKINAWQAAACADLAIRGATAPFIALYRRQATGGLDEAAAAHIGDRLVELAELESRRNDIRRGLASRGLLDAEAEAWLASAELPGDLEDAYLPCRARRKTRAAAAREAGLAPLAEAILRQEPGLDPREEAERLMASNPAIRAMGADAALRGARDIIAERVGECVQVRRALRRLFAEESRAYVRPVPGMEDRAARYRDCLGPAESLAKIPWHRYLLLRRAEAEGSLSLSVGPEPAKVASLLASMYIAGPSPAGREVEDALRDAYRRFLAHPLEAEAKQAAKRAADREATAIFAGNLKGILLAPPWGQRPVLALSPGDGGERWAVALSAEGALLECLPLSLERAARPSSPGPEYTCGSADPARPDGPGWREPRRDAGNRRDACHRREAPVADPGGAILGAIQRHGLTAVAVGSGSDCRDWELFIRGIEGLPKEVQVMVVNSVGAALYAASPAARAEFPGLGAGVKAAVFTGRRLMDPLAELVKLDPRSFVVGQFHNDVDQLTLKGRLEAAASSCVNAVGADANSDHEAKLSLVSGVGHALARNIVDWRGRNGPFGSREDLLKVPRMTPKAFEQCAGFLRVRGPNPLDATRIHPESYHLAEKMAEDVGAGVRDLMRDPALRARVDLSRYSAWPGGREEAGRILSELTHPFRDPRGALAPFAFDPDVRTPDDLAPGMRLPGLVTNVTAFGAFVDLGVKLEGLVHLSELSDSFVRSPSDVVKVGQEVTVTVLSVEPHRGRISLTLRDNRPLREGRAGTGREGARQPHGTREGLPGRAAHGSLAPDLTSGALGGVGGRGFPDGLAGRGRPEGFPAREGIRVADARPAHPAGRARAIRDPGGGRRRNAPGGGPLPSQLATGADPPLRRIKAGTLSPVAGAALGPLPPGGEG